MTAFLFCLDNLTNRVITLYSHTIKHRQEPRFTKKWYSEKGGKNTCAPMWRTFLYSDTLRMINSAWTGSIFNLDSFSLHMLKSLGFAVNTFFFGSWQYWSCLGCCLSVCNFSMFLASVWKGYEFVSQCAVCLSVRQWRVL